MMSNKILAVIDSTSLSQQAIEIALQVAQKKRSALDIVFCEHHHRSILNFGFTMIASLSYSGYVPIDQYAAEDLLIIQAEDQDKLNQLQWDAVLAGIDASIFRVEGSPSPVIAELTEQYSYKLIVIGDRRVQRNSKRLFKHVRRKMEQSPRCPILIMQ